MASAVDSAASWTQENTPAWDYDFSEGYISTAPLYIDEKILVRTSGSSNPSVTALSVEGTFLWRHSNPNSTNNDMSPLLPVSAGEGECGAWPELVLVGWTDGVLEALHPGNGTVYWSVQTEVVGWGITGAGSVFEGHVFYPTRQGLGMYCMADGSQQWWTETGLGWRNGVTLTNSVAYVGDESGTLWRIDSTGEAYALASFEGKIRHAPLISQSGILVHVQSSMDSTVFVLHHETGLVLQQFPAGPSPALPVIMDDVVVLSDSESIHFLLCRDTCALESQIPFHSNGEIGINRQGNIVIPSNTPNSNWAHIVHQNGSNAILESLDVGLYGYGTAAPLWFRIGGVNYTVFGDDQSVLKVYQNLPPDEILESNDFDWSTQSFLFATYLLLGSSAVFFLNGRRDLFVRTSSLLLVLVLLLLLPDVTQLWSSNVNEVFEETSEADEWDENWPDSWLGTQIVVFQFAEGEQAIGGLVGHQDVLSLTQSAVDDFDYTMTVEQTSIGAYISSINGIQGEGWEFYVDGSKGVLSADTTAIDSTTIVRWTPV